MEYVPIILKQIFIMFLIILIGVLCYKTKLITVEGKRSFSALVLNLVCPAVVFMAYQTEYSPELLSGLLWALLLSGVSYLVTILLANVIVRNKPGRETAIERFALIYSNCAFMGLPLINGVYGEKGVLYLTAYLTLFNLLVWTHGVMIMKNEVSAKGLLRALKSPTVIAVLVGFFCYVTNLRLPDIPRQAFNYIASLNTPLAMLVAGVTIAQTNLFRALKNIRIYLVIALKLLILPIISAVFMSLFRGVPEIVYMSVVIATACPTAATGTLFAIIYGKNELYSSEVFALTTILSAVTLPIVMLIAGLLR